jgi:hypothetical protein
MVAVPLRNALIAIQQPASASNRRSLGIKTFVVCALSSKYVKKAMMLGQILGCVFDGFFSEIMLSKLVGFVPMWLSASLSLTQRYRAVILCCRDVRGYLVSYVPLSLPRKFKISSWCLCRLPGMRKYDSTFIIIYILIVLNTTWNCSVIFERSTCFQGFTVLTYGPENA